MEEDEGRKEERKEGRKGTEKQAACTSLKALSTDNPGKPLNPSSARERKTMMKSKMFQPSLKYFVGAMAKILKNASAAKIEVNTCTQRPELHLVSQLKVAYRTELSA